VAGCIAFPVPEMNQKEYVNMGTHWREQVLFQAEQLSK
jgi:hypothetical protein